MKNIFDYRMVILDDEAQIIFYTTDLGMHQDCLNDFAKRKNYQFSNIEDIVRKGNVIFYNAGSNMLVIYLPNKLTENQLYQLDYLENYIEGAIYIDAEKIDENGKVVQQFHFNNIKKDNILGTPRERFSNELIQSYYKKEKRR